MFYSIFSKILIKNVADLWGTAVFRCNPLSVLEKLVNLIELQKNEVKDLSRNHFPTYSIPGTHRLRKRPDNFKLRKENGEMREGREGGERQILTDGAQRLCAAAELDRLSSDWRMPKKQRNWVDVWPYHSSLLFLC